MNDDPRFGQIERELERNAGYRHEMRGDMAKTATEVAVMHTELNGLREDFSDFAEETNTHLEAISATSAAGVEERGRRRFQIGLTLFAAIIGPMVGGAIALLFLGGGH